MPNRLYTPKSSLILKNVLRVVNSQTTSVIDDHGNQVVTEGKPRPLAQPKSALFARRQ